jgi:Flp pilus assembly protein TadG
MLRPAPSARRATQSLLGEESGQAAVEFVAVLPLVALLLALGWQAVLAGHTAWAAATAARAAARAAAVGDDPERAAKGRLEPRLARSVAVHDDAEGHVRVSVAVPTVMPGVRLGRIDGEATFRPQEGG